MAAMAKDNGDGYTYESAEAAEDAFVAAIEAAIKAVKLPSYSQRWKAPDGSDEADAVSTLHTWTPNALARGCVMGCKQKVANGGAVASKVVDGKKIAPTWQERLTGIRGEGARLSSGDTWDAKRAVLSRDEIRQQERAALAEKLVKNGVAKDLTAAMKLLAD